MLFLLKYIFLQKMVLLFMYTSNDDTYLMDKMITKMYVVIKLIALWQFMQIKPCVAF